MLFLTSISFQWTPWANPVPNALAHASLAAYLLAYDSTEIEAEYKQAGYLGVNRQKLDSLIIPLGYSIANINNNPLKSIELVKNNIAYRGDRTLEGGINQSLNLKMIYEKSQKNTIDPQIYLKEIKNYSKIDERYEVINLL